MYVIIIEDRHRDPAVELWADRADAIDRAEHLLGEMSGPGVTRRVEVDGWVWCGEWGGESDCIRVVEAPIHHPDCPWCRDGTTPCACEEPCGAPQCHWDDNRYEKGLKP